ncbi:hypothetical protein DM794_06270 [Paenarthrobacter ureafaciens]|uniref:hypothetical protein n=1 Tax=Paenarthrobacter ureafaciens TaxID=37931 RepID=UPI003DA08165|nr:hypothetical protein [Paenarthrobacter ureafaciens]
MCRAKEVGARRCPGCKGSAARDAHNARRRDNRAVKAQILAWAAEESEHQKSVEALKGLPPAQAKEWARQRGAPAAILSPPKPKQHDGKAVIRQLDLADQFWVTPELARSIEAMQSLQGKHPREGALLTGHLERTMRLDGHSDGSAYYPLDGPVNVTRIACFDNGDIAFHKPFSGLDTDCAEDYGQESAIQPVHEAAAWHLAKNLGKRYEKLVPPCVIRVVDDRMGSLSLGVPGDPGDPTAVHLRNEADDAAFFDCLVGQQDRHLGNLLIDNQSAKLHLIDHGFTFARPGDTINVSMLVRFRIQHGGLALAPHETKALRNVLRSHDLFGLSKVLEPERSEALRARAAKMLTSGQLEHKEF